MLPNFRPIIYLIDNRFKIKKKQINYRRGRININTHEPIVKYLSLVKYKQILWTPCSFMSSRTGYYKYQESDIIIK
jgi:hypothetical protein